MSIISEAFDSVVNFFDFGDPNAGLGAFNPNTGGNVPAAPTVNPVATPVSSADYPTAPSYSIGQGIKDIATIAGPIMSIARPYITAKVNKPERPKFPEVPDSVKNDPRVEKLLGAYGFTNGTMPTIKEQSAFQAAFPTMFSAATNLINNLASPAQELPKQILNQSQTVLDSVAKKTPSTTVTPAEVAESTAVQTTALLAEPAPMSTAADKDIWNAVQSTSKYDDLIQDSAKQHNIDPNLLRAIIQQESTGRADAVGDGGKAIGLGQMHAAAAADAAGRPVSPEELKDPMVAIPLVAKHLATLNNAFGGNTGDPSYEKTISAYNAGKRGSENPAVYASSQVTRYRDTVKKRLSANRQQYS